MAIYKALLRMLAKKYGYAEFKLEILEYCSIEELIIREQFYFDKFNPEYNILKIAGSGRLHLDTDIAKPLKNS